MNIKHNRYILFIGPLIWTFVALSTPKTIEAGIFTLWFVLTNLYDMCEISHERIYKYSPDQISKWRRYLCTETVITCWFSSMGFPKLSVLGILLIKVLKNPIRISSVLGMIWMLFWGLSFFINWIWFLGVQPRWYGLFIISWGLIRYAIKLEIEALSTGTNSLKKYMIIWLLRFAEQIILSSVRWFTWCDCVFPYQQRYDVWFYGLLLTSIGMWLVSYKRPQKMLKFEQAFDEFHMPAPCVDTAQKCNICRDKQHYIDIEHGTSFMDVRPKHSIL